MPCCTQDCNTTSNSWAIRKRVRLTVLCSLGVITCYFIYFPEALPLSRQQNVAKLLEDSIRSVRLIQRKLEYDASGHFYKDSFDKADTLLKMVKGLKQELQVGAAAASAQPLTYCTDRHQCNLTRPIEKLVSIAINIVEASLDVIERLPIVLNAIRAQHPDISVNVAIPDNYRIQYFAEGRSFQIRWLRSTEQSAAEMWNRLVEESETPYVLIARDLLHFDKNAFLEKQIKTLLTTGAVSVGGAARGLEGHWRAECYQMQIGVYTMKVEDGYRKSVESCMKCDYIGGAFVIHKKRFKLNPQFKQAEAFIHFFFNLFNSNALSLVCLEVMYFRKHSDFSTLSRYDLKRFAKNESFDTFEFPKQRLEYSCSELDIECTPRGYGRSMPRCCSRDHVEGLAKVFNYCKERGITYYIRHGVLLTATKLRDIVTWDFDSDVEMTPTGFYDVRDRWWSEKDFTSYIEKSGRPSSRKVLYKTNRIEFFTKSIEAISPVIGDLPDELKSNSTLVNLNSHWFVSPSNPGLWVVNQYGKHCLKHKQNDAFTQDKYINEGECPLAKKQMCLNLYPPDGNLDLYP